MKNLTINQIKNTPTHYILYFLLVLCDFFSLGLTLNLIFRLRLVRTYLWTNEHSDNFDEWKRRIFLLYFNFIWLIWKVVLVNRQVWVISRCDKLFLKRLKYLRNESLKIHQLFMKIFRTSFSNPDASAHKILLPWIQHFTVNICSQN